MADIIFAFVVLHYNEPKVTEKCVKAIRENTKKYSSEIVIVDNCSPDGSGVIWRKNIKTNRILQFSKQRKIWGLPEEITLGIPMQSRRCMRIIYV